MVVLSTCIELCDQDMLNKKKNRVIRKPEESNEKKKEQNSLHVCFILFIYMVLFSCKNYQCCLRKKEKKNTPVANWTIPFFGDIIYLYLFLY